MPIDINYLPYQGQVKSRGAYQSIIPAPPLNYWVQCFWQLDVPKGGFYYRSLPDNSVDWIINTKYPDDNFLITPFLSSILFQLAGPVSYFGIRFRILGHQGLVTTPLGEWHALANSIQSIDLLQKGLLESANQHLANTSSFKGRCESLSRLLLKTLKQPKIDPRLARYIRYCHATNSSSVNLSDKQCSEFGLSARQLRRLSQLYLGVSPRAFSRVLRFQHAIHLINTKTVSTQWTEGYYDQSHFIKEFKQLSGLTPVEFRNLSVLYNTTLG
jgi:methylphosphotriester-DNA--protein-cysteine methyltransferase